MSQRAPPDQPSTSLSSVIATDELFRRPSRLPDYQGESRALTALAQELGSSPRGILQKLVDASLGLCKAHSAGISLLGEEDGRSIFRWPAIAGEWAAHVGGTTPRDFSPCGVVLDRDSVQLFVRFDRYYPYFSVVARPTYEALLIPFHVDGEAVGTVWVVSHDQSREFDSEDFRLLSSIAKFASAAFGVLSSLEKHTLMEASLRQSEEQARLALEVARLGTLRWEREGHTVLADVRCREICGFDFEATLSIANILSRIHPEDRPRIEALRSAVAADGLGHYAEELRFIDDHGLTRWVVSHGQIRFERHEDTWRAAAMMGTVLDITERKMAEEALKDADRRKDVFLATLAHELRNPLAPLRNSLQIMRIAADNHEATERARNIMDRQLGHMVRLIDDLLDVNRVSQGKVELCMQRVELASVIRSAVETSRPQIEAGGHELTLNIPLDSILVNADAMRLAQVFANLLNNAAKYTERGGHIQLAIERLSGKVVATVKDTGVGIAAQALPKVFDMFTQVSSSLSRSQGGLGVGLNIARQLAELHGGSIEARSDGLGRGSEFVVTLPLAISLVGAYRPEISRLASHRRDH